jgi:hypothetical protein
MGIRARHDFESRPAEAKTAFGEHRSGAYLKYVGTGARLNAACSPAWRLS